MSDQKVKDWHQSAAIQLLKYKHKEDFEPRAHISIHFLVKDNRRRDLDNMLAGCLDSLVIAGIIKDDAWQCIKITSLDASIDKENPRSEITIVSGD